MPELPEVETIRQDLRKKVLNKKIVHVEVLKNKAVGGMHTKFVHALTGNAIVDINRRGKLLIFSLAHAAESGEKKVLVHLKMTGQLIYEKKVHNKIEVVAGGHKLTEKDFDLPNAHTQVVFSFADHGKLFFNDLRRFGYMLLSSEKQVAAALARFGIEPLTKNYTWPAFVKALGERKVTIKVALMDQPKIAGIGNIYADEICHCVGLLPTRVVTSLTPAEKKKIFACAPRILKLAIKHRGTTFKDYMDTEGKKGNYTNFLQVFDRDGEKCHRCAETIKKIKSNGRGTHFCPGCQK